MTLNTPPLKRPCLRDLELAYGFQALAARDYAFLFDIEPVSVPQYRKRQNPVRLKEAHIKALELWDRVVRYMAHWHYLSFRNYLESLPQSEKKKPPTWYLKSYDETGITRPDFMRPITPDGRVISTHVKFYNAALARARIAILTMRPDANVEINEQTPPSFYVEPHKSIWAHTDGFLEGFNYSYLMRTLPEYENGKLARHIPVSNAVHPETLKEAVSLETEPPSYLDTMPLDEIGRQLRLVSQPVFKLENAEYIDAFPE